MAGTVTQKLFFRDNSISILEFDCTAAVGGTLTSVNAKNRNGDDIDFRGEIVNAIEYEPISPGPTNGVADITLTTESGIDICGGGFADVSATVSSMLTPKATAVSWDFPLFDTLTLALASNAVASARFKIRVFFVRGTNKL